MQTKPELKLRVKIEYKDDPGLYEQIMRILLLAYEISDMDKVEAEAYQKKYFDNI